MAYSLLVSFHVAAGTLALLTFWVTAALRAGSPPGDAQDAAAGHTPSATASQVT